MATKKGRVAKPLGRPPATTSAETHKRILDAARRCFAEFGYDGTTNQRIAELADITTGAIYHYYDSKQELFAAVAEQVNGRVWTEFEQATGEVETFSEKLVALLERALELHREDRSIAAFSCTFPLELQRRPEVLGSIPPAILTRSQEFFHRLATDAIARGELTAGTNPQAVGNMITAATIGFAYLGTVLDDIDVHAAAMDAFARLVEGRLLATPLPA